MIHTFGHVPQRFEIVTDDLVGRAGPSAQPSLGRREPKFR